MNIVTHWYSPCWFLTLRQLLFFFFTFLKLHVCQMFLQKEFWMSPLISPLKTFGWAVWNKQVNRDYNDVSPAAVCYRCVPQTAADIFPHVVLLCEVPPHRDSDTNTRRHDTQTFNWKTQFEERWRDVSVRLKSRQRFPENINRTMFSAGRAAS